MTTWIVVFAFIRSKMRESETFVIRILPGDKDSSLHFVSRRNDRRFRGYREGNSGDLIECLLKGKIFFKSPLLPSPRHSKIACHPDPASAGEGSH